MVATPPATTQTDPATATLNPNNPFAISPTQQLTPSQAGDLLRASAAGYGVGPDPQLSTEAMLMGSTSTLSSTLATSDPSLQSAILAQPIGQSQFVQKGVAPPTNLFNNPYQYDPNQAKQQMQQYQKMGIPNSFQSMGELPIANAGWYQSILDGNSDEIKKWQQFLADRGFYGQTDANGQNFQKGETNGYTSPQFKQAMSQWALAYFAPMALYSRDPQELTSAKQFLSTIGFDTDALASSMANNPQERTKVIDSWMTAQGPDGDKMSALDNFSNQYGSDALPDQLKQLRGDGVFGSVGRFLGHIPGVGNLLGTTPDQLDAKLTPAEQEALNPTLQKTQDNSPFKFIGDILGAPSKAVITAGYFFGDAISGHLGQDNINPFDPNSKVTSFANDPMHEMFGNNVPGWLHVVGNIAMGVADDPLTYIPFVGTTHLAEEIGKGIEGFDDMSDAEKAAAVSQKMTPVERATKGLVSHRTGALRYGYMKPTTVVRGIANDGLKSTLTKALDPFGASQRSMAEMFTKTATQTGEQLMDTDMARNLLGDYSEDSAGKIQQLMDLGKKGNTEDVLGFLRDPKNQYAHNFYDASFLGQRNHWETVLRNTDKLSQGKQLHLWNTLHMSDSSSLVDLKKPQEAVETYRNAMTVAGVPLQNVQKFANDFWKTDVQGRRKLTDDATSQIEKAQESKSPGWVNKYTDWRNAYRSSAQKTVDMVSHATEHDPTKPGQKLSTRKTALHFTRDFGGRTADDLNQEAGAFQDNIDQLEGNFRQKLDAAAEHYSDTGEATDASRAKALNEDWGIQKAAQLHTQQVQDLQSHLDELEKNFGGSKGNVPVGTMTTQASQFAHLPYTASEIMSYNNKFLRKSESTQRRLGIDKAMGFWKTSVLSKPSTLMNVMFGDESARGHIDLLLNDPKTWVDYAKGIVTRRKSVTDVATGESRSLEDLMSANSDMATNIHNLAGAESSERPLDLYPGGAGYKEALTEAIQNHYSQQQWVKGWMSTYQKAQGAAAKGGVAPEDAAHNYLKEYLGGESEEARNLRDLAGINRTDQKGIDNLAATKNYDVSSFLNYDATDADRKKMWKWVKSGNVDQNELAKLESHYSENPNATYVLPRLNGRPPARLTKGGNPITDATSRYHDWASHKIGLARMRVFAQKSNSEYKRISSYYQDASGNLTVDPEKLHQMAESSARTWVKRNTYQGAKSVAGSALRSVAPFWGATANANRFYLHTLIEHPELAHQAYTGEEAVSQAQQQGGLKVNVPLLGAALTHLGLSQGDDFTFQPFNMSFLTREGFGGIFPGMGPVFNVALSQMPQSIKDATASLPGMQYVSSGTPMLPWLSNLASAYSLATGGQGFEAPLLGRQPGYYEKLVDDQLQQMEGDWEADGRKGPEPTAQDAKNDVAANQLITGAASYTLPIGLQSENTKHSEITNAEQSWDPGLSQADKQKFFAANPDVADYFKYIDPSTPQAPTDGQESRDDILHRSPWVLAYATGTSQSAIEGRATTADTQKQYQDDVKAGNIQTLDPTAYITKLRTQEQTQQAWNRFDRVQSAYQDWLQQTGVSSRSSEAQTYRKYEYDPVVTQIANEFPDWGATFVKQTAQTQTGLEFASKPFNTVSTFDVIPGNPALETKATTLWRAALVRRDQATSALQQVLQNHGSQFEKDMIVNGLAQQIDGLAQQDPTFASQIAQYRYSSLNDLMTSDAQAAATAAGAP